MKSTSVLAGDRLEKKLIEIAEVRDDDFFKERILVRVKWEMAIKMAIKTQIPFSPS